VIVLVAVGLVVLLAIGIAVSRAPSSTSVSVALTVYGESDCDDLGLGYFDVPGSAVTITADGSVVGTGQLSSFAVGGGFGCTYRTTVEDIPTDADFYSVEIRRRGEVTSSRAEMEEDGWSWELSLGD